MNNSCLIKSFPNGIVLHLDPEKPFADLLIDIAEKFSESRAFFKDAKMALAIKGRTLTITQAESLNGEEGNGNGQFYRGTLKTDRCLKPHQALL